MNSYSRSGTKSTSVLFVGIAWTREWLRRRAKPPKMTAELNMMVLKELLVPQRRLQLSLRKEAARAGRTYFKRRWSFAGRSRLSFAQACASRKPVLRANLSFAHTCPFRAHVLRPIMLDFATLAVNRGSFRDLPGLRWGVKCCEWRPRVNAAMMTEVKKHIIPPLAQQG